MARMSIDDMLGRDPRLVRLAKACGISKYEAAGRLVLEVWPVCYDRATAVIPEHDIDTAAGVDGFAEHMISVGLATRARIGIRISGVQERIDYLTKQRDLGRVGGLKSAESRKNRVKRPSSGPVSDPQAAPEASLKPPIASVPDPSPAQLQLVAADVPVPVSPKPPDPKTPHAVVRADVCDRYRAANGYEHPWSAKEGKLAANLLAMANGDPLEVLRRNAILYEHPPHYLTPPFDIGTLVANFSKLVAVQRPTNNRATDKPRAMKHFE